jgi:hypothetical protein
MLPSITHVGTIKQIVKDSRSSWQNGNQFDCYAMNVIV